MLGMVAALLAVAQTMRAMVEKRILMGCCGKRRLSRYEDVDEG